MVIIYLNRLKIVLVLNRKINKYGLIYIKSLIAQT